MATPNRKAPPRRSARLALRVGIGKAHILDADADLRRRAKYLLAELDDGFSLVMHLGMSGSFRVDGATPGGFHHPRDKSAAHDHVVFHLDNDARVTFNDPRRFGYMLLAPTAELDAHKLFRGLGVEPLSEALDATFLARSFSGRKAPAKATLLDQRIVAGLGNIYVCEALHRAHISPKRAAGRIAENRLDDLTDAVRAVLREAIEAGGSSLKDYAQTDGALGYFQHRFRVYDGEGEPCVTPGCTGVVKRIVQGGRSTFFCPHCQKR